MNKRTRKVSCEEFRRWVTLKVPAGGLVYRDADPVIQDVEEHPVYGPLLQHPGQAANARTIEVIGNELVLME